MNEQRDQAGGEEKDEVTGLGSVKQAVLRTGAST